MLVIDSEGRRPCTAWLAIACMAGMLVGLAIDALNGRLTSLGAICSFGTRSFIDSMRLHWSELPAMHAGMSVVMLGALPFGVARTMRCYGIMLVGMEAGPALIQQLPVARVASTTLVSMMIAGMLLGMVAARAAAEAISGSTPSQR